MQLPRSIAQHEHEVAGLLGDPGAVGVGGHPSQTNPPGIQLDAAQHEQPPQPDGLDGGEVARDDPGGLLAEEGSPARGCRARRRIEGVRRSVAQMLIAETWIPSRRSSP
jgi:hypothetical protein